MRRLYVNGCSFVWGQELEDRENESFPYNLPRATPGREREVFVTQTLPSKTMVYRGIAMDTRTGVHRNGVL